MKLAANLDLGAAAPLRQSLLDARGAPIALDASDVERIGALCLQILLSARATWGLDGHEFRIVGPSPGFLECARTMMGESCLTDQGEVS